MALRCLIVDDNHQFVDVARYLLERDGIDVVGIGSNGGNALRLAAELQPDVVLVDIHLGDDDGFDVARWLVAGRDGFGTAVILMSTYAGSDLRDVIANGPAAGFLAKADLSGAAIHATLGAHESS